MTTARALAHTFGAFRLRWYRWFWSARALGAIAFRFRAVVRGWLIYNLTGSAFALSAVSSTWGVATLLFSAPGGALSDRFGRRKLIILGQAIAAVAFFSVAGLIFTGGIRVWHLAASSLVMGIVFSIVIPARTTLLSDLMPRDTLLNAMALTMAGMGVMGVLASAVSGVLVEELGVGAVYAFMGMLYVAAVIIYFRVPPGEQRQAKHLH